MVPLHSLFRVCETYFVVDWLCIQHASPNPRGYRDKRVYPVPHGNDGIQVVEKHIFFYRTSKSSIHDDCKFCSCREFF